MKIILNQDVAKVGKKLEIVDVSDGFAQNFLIKKKLGVVATKANIASAESQKVDLHNNYKKDISEAETLAAKIKTLKLEFKVKEKNGKIFGSISTKQIALALNDLKIKIDKRNFSMDHQLNSLGNHEVHIKLHKEVEAILTVSLIAE